MMSKDDGRQESSKNRKETICDSQAHLWTVLTAPYFSMSAVRAELSVEYWGFLVVWGEKK